MDLDKKFREAFRTQDEAYKDYMSITETNWHFDGDGKGVGQVGETGIFTKKDSMGRIVEFFRLQESVGLGPPPSHKVFSIYIRLDIKVLGFGDRKEVVGNRLYEYGESIDKPIDFYSSEVRELFPKAWEEFKNHRGYLYHSGQWIKSMYLQYLEDKEKANVGNNNKSKSSGSH